MTAWAANPAAITPRDLLLQAADAIEHWPEGAPAHDPNPQHPEDAWCTASVVLDTVAGLRIAEWQANRSATAT